MHWRHDLMIISKKTNIINSKSVELFVNPKMAS